MGGSAHAPHTPHLTSACMWGETPHTPHVFARPPDIVHGSARRSPSAQRGLRRADRGTLSLRRVFACGGQSPPHPPIILPAHPPFLRNPLATSARKTHRLRLWRDCLWQRGCRKTRRLHGWQSGVGGEAFPQRGEGGWGGGSAHAPHTPRLAFALHVGGFAPHVGGDPPHPPCFLPTHPTFVHERAGGAPASRIFWLRPRATGCRRKHRLHWWQSSGRTQCGFCGGEQSRRSGGNGKTPERG